MTDENRGLLESARRLCQTGILKRLGEQINPQWNNVIMGDIIASMSETLVDLG